MTPEVPSKASSSFTRRALALGGLAAAAGVLAYCSSGADTAAAAAALRRPLDLGAPDPHREIVRFATLAANGHNTQPWTFSRTVEGLSISPDFGRRTPVVDPDDHHLFVSLGCAAENALVAASGFGMSGAYAFDAEAQRIGLAFAPGRAVTSDALAAAVPKRQCTRSVYAGTPVPPDHLELLRRAAALDGVEVALVSGRPALNRIRNAVIEANAGQMRDKAFVDELLSWIRFSTAEAVSTGDGLFGAASGNPALPDWLGRLIFPMVFTIDGETEKYRKQLDTSAGVAIFVAAQEDPVHWALSGRAYQRFALQAAALGIKHAHINQPTELPSARAAFAAAVGFAGRRVDLVVRFGHAPDLPFSLRRPVSAVLGS